MTPLSTYYRYAASADGSTGQNAAHSLQGRARLMPGGYLGDATGYRKIIGCHLFPFFHFVSEGTAATDVAQMQRAGMLTARIAHLLACNGNHPTPPEDTFYGRDVCQGKLRETLIPGLDLLRSAGIKAILTAGHEYASPNDEYGWWDELTGRIADAGHSETIALVEALGNEVDANRGWLSANVQHAMQYVKPIHSIIRRNLPGVLISNGDFGNESTALAPGQPDTEPTLITSSEGADLMDVHTPRDWPQNIRHLHTQWKDTHYNHYYPKAQHQGEEGYDNLPYLKGQPGAGVYNPTDNPTWAHTRCAFGVVCGQLVSYLNGPGVLREVPLNSTIWFNKIVASMDPIPEDIPLWRDENNPSWWIRGKEFVYVGLAEWGQLANPPHPVAKATFYNMDGAVGEAQTNLVPPKGWTGGIVRGVFA